MRVRVLGCSGGSAPGRQPSCYLLDGGLAIDAGALASSLSLDEQQALSHVWLTHAHWDHVRDLPLTAINRTPDAGPLEVHGLGETVNAVRAHLMNADVWFPAFDLPSIESPFITATAVAPGETQQCGPYTITSVPVPHTVPATSYLIDDGESSILINADTGGGGIFKNLPVGRSPLRAVFLEASFPNRMKNFALMTGHLTPEMLEEEVGLLGPDVSVIVTHMKPGHEVELSREIADLRRRDIHACRDGDVLHFGKR